MVQVTVGRWGNNLAVRLPGEIVDAIKLQDGERVEIEAHDSGAVIRRARQRVSLEDLFRGRSPDEWRADYAGAYDWGPEVGREIIPE
jgi:antitoxin MazE